LGRVLAHDLVSPLDVPPHDNSAMDGYALRGIDLLLANINENPTSLLQFTIIGNALAGTPTFNTEIASNQCVRIMTGAIMPAGCDTVIPQELVSSLNADSIVIDPRQIKPGDHRRLRGEDIKMDHIVLRQGRILQAADIGLLASLGIAEITVRQRLRVAVFSTGDELIAPGSALATGQIYDSNRYTLQAMLQRLGCETIDMGIVNDHPATLRAAFEQAAQQADVIITSGGVSAGIADFTKQTMAALGEVFFWNINMRPGRPLAFGQIHSADKSAYLFALPGNPVAVMVSFYFFVRDALLQMMQATPNPLPLLPVTIAHTIRKRMERTEYLRGILKRTDGGQLSVSTTGAQGSGILRSMSEANCMIILPAEKADINTGEVVNVILFEGLI
jgi:molybdopterin molybdotransferase